MKYTPTLRNMRSTNLHPQPLKGHPLPSTPRLATPPHHHPRLGVHRIPLCRHPLHTPLRSRCLISHLCFSAISLPASGGSSIRPWPFRKEGYYLTGGGRGYHCDHFTHKQVSDLNLLEATQLGEENERFMALFNQFRLFKESDSALQRQQKEKIRTLPGPFLLQTKRKSLVKPWAGQKWNTV